VQTFRPVAAPQPYQGTPLRKEAPIHQKPAPVFPSQPAAAKFQGNRFFLLDFYIIIFIIIKKIPMELQIDLFEKITFILSCNRNFFIKDYQFSVRKNIT
jgi:hypothetical protein